MNFYFFPIWKKVPSSTEHVKIQRRAVQERTWISTDDTVGDKINTSEMKRMLEQQTGRNRVGKKGKDGILAVGRIDKSDIQGNKYDRVDGDGIVSLSVKRTRGSTVTRSDSDRMRGRETPIITNRSLEGDDGKRIKQEQLENSKDNATSRERRLSQRNARKGVENPKEGNGGGARKLTGKQSKIASCQVAADQKKSMDSKDSKVGPTVITIDDDQPMQYINEDEYMKEGNNSSAGQSSSKQQEIATKQGAADRKTISDKGGNSIEPRMITIDEEEDFELIDQTAVNGILGSSNKEMDKSSNDKIEGLMDKKRSNSEEYIKVMEKYLPANSGVDVDQLLALIRKATD